MTHFERREEEKLWNQFLARHQPSKALRISLDMVVIAVSNQCVSCVVTCCNRNLIPFHIRNCHELLSQEFSKWLVNGL